MTILYSELTKLKKAKQIAQSCGCFIYETQGYNNKLYILYRENKHGINTRLGSNRTIDGILKRVKLAAKAEK